MGIATLSSIASHSQMSGRSCPWIRRPPKGPRRCVKLFTKGLVDQNAQVIRLCLRAHDKGLPMLAGGQRHGGLIKQLVLLNLVEVFVRKNSYVPCLPSSSSSCRSNDGSHSVRNEEVRLRRCSSRRPRDKLPATNLIRSWAKSIVIQRLDHGTANQHRRLTRQHEAL